MPNLSLTSKQFWTDSAERAVRTGAQVAVAAFGGSAVLTAVTEGDWLSIPWQESLGLVILSMVLSLLTSIAGKKVGDPSTASLTKGTAPNALGKGGSVHTTTTRPTL